MTPVADALLRSRGHHIAAQACRKKGDRAGHLAHCREALSLRLEAHQRDPDHADPAWAAEVTSKYRHDALVRFYTHELTQGEMVPPTRAELLGRLQVKAGAALAESLAYQQVCREVKEG